MIFEDRDASPEKSGGLISVREKFSLIIVFDKSLFHSRPVPTTMQLFRSNATEPETHADQRRDFKLMHQSISRTCSARSLICAAVIVRFENAFPLAVGHLVNVKIVAFESLIDRKHLG